MPLKTDRPIVWMGSKACSVLSLGCHGTVLAATSRVVYLRLGQEEPLWLTSSGDALHRRSIQIAGSLPEAQPGAECIAVDGRLVLGAHVLDGSGASVWQPAPLRVEDVLSADRLPGYLASMTPSLAHMPSPAGFGVLIPAILAHVGNRPALPASSSPSPWASRAWPAARDLVNSCLAGDFLSALRRADDLIGLGEGLTPSGDDFVGALLYWLARVREHRPGFSSLDSEDVAEFLRRTRPRTNEISHVLLADHALGHASNALQHLVDGLLTGQKDETIARRAARLIRIGHSTGWDLLAGVVAGAMATSGIHPLGRPVHVSAPTFLPNERG